MAIAAPPTYADVTGFIGLSPTPSTRFTRGFAAGLGLVIVGFEFEYAKTSEDETLEAPSLTTGMGNLYLQTPFPVHGLQFYGTVGGGIYREALTGVREETHFAANVGGGVKITLVGPLRLRLDYRLFTLRGSPLYSKPQRLYAGLTLAF